jgi:MFS family permease
MSAYFVGFLIGSLAGTVNDPAGRTCAGLCGAGIADIGCADPLPDAGPDWLSWSLMRALIGFCFAGVYVTAESWLNNTCDERDARAGDVAYMIVQMLGIITSQALLNIPDPSGFVLFILPVGAGVTGLHADPAGGDTPPRPLTPSARLPIPPAFQDFAPGLRGHAADGGRLCRDVRHGGGLGCDEWG